MTVTRRAGPLDLEDLVALVQESCTLDHHEFELERVRAALRPLLTDDDLGEVWLVDDPEHQGGPVGYAVMTWRWSLESGGRDCLLDRFYVRARGQGLRTTALSEVVARSQAAGASVIVLVTEAHDRRAREFYGKAGFDLEDSLWMSLRLPPMKS